MSYLKHKPGSIEEMMANQAKKLNDNAYQDMFKKELEKAGRGIGAMSPKEKKDFFNKIDDKYKAKKEEEVNKKDVDKFHTSLDKLVHKSFGHSSDEKKKEVKEEDAYDKDDEKPKSKPKKEAVDNPYAVGMAAAMKAKDDKPPLKKSTITKAHDIAKSIEKDQKESVEINEADITLHDHDSTDKDFKDLVRKSNLTMKVKKGYKGDDVTLSGNSSNIENMLKTMYGSDWNKTYKKSGNRYIEAEYKKEDYTKKDVDKFHTSLDKLVHKSFGHSSDEKKKEMKEARWEIEGRVNYKGVGPEDGFHMVIDAPTESAAEDKAFDELVKARKQRKIGPGGGGNIDEMEIEYIEKTNDRLQPVTQQRLGNSYDPTQKEEVHPHVKKMVKDGESDEKIKKMHPKTTDKDLEKLKETHMSTAKAQNQKQVDGEKEPIKTPKNEWKTFAMMAAELREKKEEKEDKKEMQAGDDTRDKSKKTMTGQVATSPEMNPKVDYKY